MCAGLHSTKRSPPAGPSGSRLGGRTPHPRVAGGQVAGAAGRQVDKATTAQLDYSGATFSGGTVNFSGAEFSGGTVNFGVAMFSGGTVNFFRATFSGGTVNFSGAEFSGGTVNFGVAMFSGGTVNFFRATFSGGTVNFFGAEFSGGTVNFGVAMFSGGTVNFFRATFSGGTVNFFGVAMFSGGTVDLSSPEDWSVPPSHLPPFAESGANRGRRARRLVMSPDCGLGLVPAVGVECRGGGGDGVEGGLGVDGQADQAGVAALGHEDG